MLARVQLLVAVISIIALLVADFYYFLSIKIGSPSDLRRPATSVVLFTALDL